MHICRFLFLLVVLVNDYAHSEKKTKEASCTGEISVVSTSSRCQDPEFQSAISKSSSTTSSSLQRSRIHSQADFSDGGNIQATLEVFLVQEAQQTSGFYLRFMSYHVGSVHRYPLCAWPEATEATASEPVLWEKCLCSSPSDGELVGLESTLQEALFGIRQQGDGFPQKESKRQDASQEERTADQVWSPFSGSPMAD